MTSQFYWLSWGPTSLNGRKRWQSWRLVLTHWSRVTHTYISKVAIIGSDNGLSPGQRQAIIWTNAGILLIGALETNFSEILIEIFTFSFRKMHLKMSSGKWRPFCLSLNVLNDSIDLSLPGWLERQKSMILMWHQKSNFRIKVFSNHDM